MRIRTIKPEFYLHEGLFELEQESGLPVRLAFTGLWCVADREGRFKWNPRKIGVQVMPYDQIDFSRVLDALATRGFILKYVCDSVEYGCIPSFKRHQVINNRERPSELPEPLESRVIDASVTREPRVDHAGKAEGKGREGNMEGKGKDLFALDGTSSDPAREVVEWNAQSGFTGITEKDRAEWSAAFPSVNLDIQLARAHTWLVDNPAKKKKQVRRFVSGWLSRAQEKGGDIRANKPTPSHRTNGYNEHPELPD